MHHLSLSRYPTFLLSALIEGENAIAICSRTRHAIIDSDALEPKYTRNHTPAPQPQPQPFSLTFHSTGSLSDTSSVNSDSSISSTTSVAGCSLHAYLEPLREITSRVLPRIPLPLPFLDASISRRIDLVSRGCRGVNLDYWAKLSEKGKTHLAVADARAGLDETFACSDGRILFQSHWPGYATRTCFLDIPAGIADGERAFTKVDLLDMVCQALVDWVLNITNHRHIECRDPRWAIGLKQITFKHIYVRSVVEVEGYVSKWAPVLEIDPRAFET